MSDRRPAWFVHYLLVVYGLLLGGALAYLFAMALPNLLNPEAARAAGTLRMPDVALPATFTMFGTFLVHLAGASLYGLLRLTGRTSPALKFLFIAAGIAGIAAMFWLGQYL